MSPRRRRRGPGTPFAIAVVLLVLLAASALALVLVLRNRDNSTTPLTQETTTTASTGSTSTTPAARTTFLVYLVRDGVVGAASRSVPETSAVGAAALGQLLAGPTPDEESAHLSTAIPSGTALKRLTIANGLATVDLGGADLTPLAKAQVVFTLTQFPSVHTVAIDGAAPLDRKHLESLSPIILVESPTPNETVTSPLHLRGTANTFEATLQVELTDADGKVLAKRFLTATSGTGTRGTFSGTLAFHADAGTGLVLRAYEDSAENGQRIHVVEIPLVAG